MKPFTLGYIGVGLMGGPMTKRLASLGWQVRGYDIVAERSSVGSVAEAAKGADVVALNLPTNDAVEDVVAKLLAVMRSPQLVVDFSTIPVEACRSHAATPWLSFLPFWQITTTERPENSAAQCGTSA